MRVDGHKILGVACFQGLDLQEWMGSRDDLVVALRDSNSIEAEMSFSLCLFIPVVSMPKNHFGRLWRIHLQGHLGL